MPKFNVSPKLWTILATYAHVFVGAVATEYILGRHTPHDLIAAGVGSLIPPILRWANPADQFPAPSTTLMAAAHVVDVVSGPVSAGETASIPTA